MDNSEETMATPEMCETYAALIDDYHHDLEKEATRRPIADYIQKVQKNVVTKEMRGKVVDWLVELAWGWNLFQDTLYLSVSCFDRFLSIKAVGIKRLQLVAVASMFIAAKYVQIEIPTAKHLSEAIDDEYTEQEVVNMEVEILKSLEFEIGNPTVKTFLRKFMRIDDQTPSLELRSLAAYLCELSLLEYECLKFLPSEVAASAFFLSRFTLNPSLHPWNAALEELSGYTAIHLKECVQVLQELQSRKRASALREVRKKYEEDEHQRVADLASPSIPAAFFQDLKET